jgi:hypothetical protein
LEVLGRRSSLLRIAYLPKLVVFQLLKLAEANLLHAVTVTTCSLLKFIQVSLNKVKVKIQEGSNNTRVTIVLRSDSLSE